MIVIVSSNWFRDEQFLMKEKPCVETGVESAVHCVRILIRNTNVKY